MKRYPFRCLQDHYSCHRRPGSSQCNLYKVEPDSDKGGIKVVALRDIKALEIILDEYPVAIGPYTKTQPQCLECFKPCSDMKGLFVCLLV